MPPYIFVILMNVLSAVLDEAAANGVLRYHPKYKRINLTHFCFVDDLLIFTKGTCTLWLDSRSAQKVL